MGKFSTQIATTPHKQRKLVWGTRLNRLSSLGFRTKVSSRGHGESGPTIRVSFLVRSVGYDGPTDTMGTINGMIEILSKTYSEECALRAFATGDFSALARNTRRTEKHSKNGAVE